MEWIIDKPIWECRVKLKVQKLTQQFHLYVYTVDK